MAEHYIDLTPLVKVIDTTEKIKISNIFCKYTSRDTLILNAAVNTHLDDARLCYKIIVAVFDENDRIITICSSSEERGYITTYNAISVCDWRVSELEEATRIEVFPVIYERQSDS